MSSAGLVHVIDDDEAMRDSLAFLLAAERFEVVGHDSADSFLETLPSLGFACIVTDVRMPGMTGIELLHHMREVDKFLPVIVITGHSDVPLAVEALKAGAFDFIEKPFDDERMIAAIRSALEFRSRAQHQEDSRAEIRTRLDTLTERERQVFDGLVAGHPNKIIAHDLGISPRTVEIYRANVMHKLEASSLSQVVRMAFIVQGGIDGEVG
ncbi:response regulator transcription factor FixJ [Kaustia mangrovi]|uniref:Response regulator transcription factor FixJ n=1 Tax=Kaustia mangrovi TaxID=2593653 RepID=A0A7S8C3E2_9HYPH|nr:response regulator FixJ [Kaustia mangrovi]QPC42655.1 response regulator transcription factor FixJ [Kaustia mangrovi]